MTKRLGTRAYKYGLSTIHRYAWESAGACRELKTTTEMWLRAVGLPAPAILQKQRGLTCNYNDGRPGTQGPNTRGFRKKACTFQYATAASVSEGSRKTVPQIFDD